MKEARMQAENWEEDERMEVDCDDEVVSGEDGEGTPDREVSEPYQAASPDELEEAHQGDGEGTPDRGAVMAEHGTALHELENDHLESDEAMQQTHETVEPEHATSHAAPEDSESAGEEELVAYASKIRKHLHGGNKELAHVGAYLCQAKESMDKAAKDVDQEEPFTEWYQREFQLSPDRARRLMRWVRPVLKMVDWTNDDDPILGELAAIGPCVFDEIQKMEKDLWHFNREGRLILSGEVTRVGDLPVRGLSFRDIKAFRERLGAQGTKDGGGDQQPDENKSLPEKARETDGQQTDPAGDSNPEGDSVAGLEDNPTGSTEAKGDAEEDEDEEQSGSQEGETTETMPDQPNPGASVSWQYKDERVRETAVISGALLGQAGSGSARVSGFNVQFKLQNDQLVPFAVNSNEDAFLAQETDQDTTIHWFDHRKNCWRIGKIETSVTPQ